ncbi:MAG TPA: hypothetical protein VK559_02385 [Ferruginibacter sp.]|nr:hypothetical protein [Ferruginibacter sp.]
MKPPSTTISLAEKYGVYIIVLCWFLSLLVYYNLFGIFTQLEAEKYIYQADYFLRYGAMSATRYWFYSATIFIIALATKTSIGLVGAFFIQAGINLFGYLFFYKALKTIFTNITALVIIVYLLVFLPYQSWVVYLYTESVFYSSVLLLLSVLILYKPDNIKNIAIIALAVLFTIISRPLGILFAISTYLYLFYAANKKWKVIIFCGSILLLMAFYFIVNTIFSSIEDWTITKPFEEENIICDLPSTIHTTILYLDKSAGPVYQLFYYIYHNFGHFIHYAGIKLRYFFLMRRDYYSNRHNYSLLLNIIPIYILSVANLFIKSRRLKKEIMVFLVSSIFLYAVTIVLQCDDYHNRFILSIYPFFVILAAKTIEYWVMASKKIE